MSDRKEKCPNSIKIKGLISGNSRHKLELFVQMLAHWRRVTNLISENGFNHIWERHILDSVNLHLLFPSYRHWLDIGSGAGFPGIVLGVLLAEEECAQIHCVESDSRKCAFLRAVAQELCIPVKIHNERADELSLAYVGKIEAVTARAFSSIDRILQISDEFMLAGAVLVLPRGKTSTRAVEALDPRRYLCEVIANPLSVGGMFVQIRLRARV